MKYILIKISTEYINKTLPVIFDDSLVHLDMFQKTRDHIVESMKVHPARVQAVGAGFVDRQWKVHGGSSSLDLQSKPSDEIYLR